MFYRCPQFELSSNQVVATVAVTMKLDPRVIEEYLADEFAILSEGHVR